VGRPRRGLDVGRVGSPAIARGLSGVMLVTSDAHAHAGVVEAIAANLPGATWQRCRTHWTCKESSGACRVPLEVGEELQDDIGAGEV
jgi:hypothetical protein